MLIVGAITVVVDTVGTTADLPVDHRVGVAGAVGPELGWEPTENLIEDLRTIRSRHQLGQLVAGRALDKFGEAGRVDGGKLRRVDGRHDSPCGRRNLLARNITCG